MSMEETTEPKKVSVADDRDEDENEDENDLFKSAIASQPSQHKPADDPHEEDDDEDQDLFKSAIEPKGDNGHHVDNPLEDVTSGYESVKGQEDMKLEDEQPPKEDPLITQAHSVERSDTLENIKNLSSQEQSPHKTNGSGLATIDLSNEGDEELGEKEKEHSDTGEERNMADIELEDEDFKDSFLSPGLQLSGGQHQQQSSSMMPEILGAVGGQAFNGSGASASFVDMDLEDTKLDDFIRISVIEPHRIGEGMSSYIAYKVITKTNAAFFKKSEMSVIRRFSDFLGLHDKLAEKYLQNGRIIPPAPDKSVVGMTKVKLSNNEGFTERPGSPDEFLERRRRSLERFLNRVAVHPILRSDPDFRDFLELEAELPKANQTATLSGKNVMKFINRVGDKMSYLTLRMDETDSWFEEKTHAIETLDTQLRKLHLACETLYEYRRALAHNAGNLAKSLTGLSECEENVELSGALAQLSGVQEKIEIVHMEQASNDFFQLSEIVKDHIGLVAAVKAIFEERVKAWQQWQNAATNLSRKRDARRRAELQHRMEREAQIRQEITECEQQQEMAQENFEKISRLIRKEVEAFDIQRALDLKNALVKYLEAMLKSQEKISNIWDRYLPQIQRVSHK